MVLITGSATLYHAFTSCKKDSGNTDDSVRVWQTARNYYPGLQSVRHQHLVR